MCHHCEEMRSSDFTNGFNTVYVKKFDDFVQVPAIFVNEFDAMFQNMSALHGTAYTGYHKSLQLKRALPDTWKGMNRSAWKGTQDHIPYEEFCKLISSQKLKVKSDGGSTYFTGNMDAAVAQLLPSSDEELLQLIW